MAYSQVDILNELAKKIGKLNKDLCCKLNELIDAIDPSGASTCENPVYTNLCQIDDLTSRLDGIINAVENITIDVGDVTFDTQPLEDLLTEIINVLENSPDQNTYNNVKQQETTSATITINANSVHSISYKILAGTVNITIGTDTLSYTQGESDSETADTLIVQQYVFTPQAGARVKIKTIY